MKKEKAQTNSSLKEMLKKFTSKKISKRQFFILLFLLITLIIISIFVFQPIKRSLIPHIKLDETRFVIQASAKASLGEIRVSGDIPEIRSMTNPINGNLITQEKYDELKNKKVYGVVINNHPEARPQHGLSVADFVMEIQAEGGISRYFALFYENNPEKIGPVRSLRRYMIDFASEFDSPVILHEGWASFNSSNTVYVRETDAARDVAEFKIKSMQSGASRYRDLEKAAKSGYVHSLYTSYNLIDKEFQRYQSQVGWENKSDIKELPFKFESIPEDRGKGGKIDISFLSFGDKYSKSGFIYNKNTNSYDRIIVGKEDIDALNKKRVSPKNVVIEWHDYRPANDGYARLIINMTGEGKVTIYRDGKEFAGRWKKKDKTARTEYFDENNNPIELNRGQIWKSVVFTSGGKEVSKITYTPNE